MIDLETLSTRRTAAIAQIGAVEFDPFSDQLGRTFRVNVALESCVLAGLHFQEQTFAWWAQQRASAKISVFTGQRVDLTTALTGLKDFVGGGGDSRVWADPSEFDHAVILNACDAVGVEYPWPRRATRDARTFKEEAWRRMGVVTAPPYNTVGTEHDALDDAVWQARVVQAVNAALRAR